MALVIPEIQLLKLTQGLLNLVRNNYATKVNDQDTILYKMFGGQSIGGYDYYDQVRAIVLPTQDKSRKLEVFKYFNQKRAHLPTVHIVVSADSPGSVDQGLGFDFEGESLNRVFDSRLTVLITSDNYEEAMIIYYLLSSLFIMGVDSFEYSGMRNIKLSGGDVQLAEQITPPVFSKTIGVDCIYDRFTPAIDEGGLINSIDIEEVVVEKFDPEVVYRDIVWQTYEW